MLLRNHPKIQWPPEWSGSKAQAPLSEKGQLRQVDLFEKDREGPTRLLLAVELQGRSHFAEVGCDNGDFIHRLYEKIKPMCGRTVKEIGNIIVED